jgi:fructokinase
VVGDDEFGRLLDRKLAAEGIERFLRFTAEAKTGLWFVALDAAGERTFFAPMGAESADKLLDDGDARRLPPSRWLHCGSSAHVRPAGQAALRAAVALARSRGTLVSFDPNVREHLWRDPADLRALCAAVIPSCALVKLAEEETWPCLGETTPEGALLRMEQLGVRLGCVTLGARGAVARAAGRTVEVAAPRVEVLDTTGAGDGFVAALLATITLDLDLQGLNLFSQSVEISKVLDLQSLQHSLRFACAVASRVCTRLGAVAGLPTRAEALALELAP